MTSKEKLVVELIVMQLASYMHTLAIWGDNSSRDAIDQTWQTFKQSAASIFRQWDE